MKIIELKKVLVKPNGKNHYCKFKNSVKDEPGVYLLFDKDLKLLYVGQSQHMRCRLSTHISKINKDRYNINKNNIRCSSPIPLGCVKYFSFIKIEDESNRLTTEQILIQILKPIFNGGNKKQKVAKYFNIIIPEDEPYFKSSLLKYKTI